MVECVDLKLGGRVNLAPSTAKMADIGFQTCLASPTEAVGAVPTGLKTDWSVVEGCIVK